MKIQKTIMQGTLKRQWAKWVFSEKMGHPEPIKIVIIKVSQITENLW